MFTGIVQAVGTVRRAEDRDGVLELAVEVAPAFLEGTRAGASISVDGACLTPVRVEPGRFHVEVIGSTRARTVAGRYRKGSRVNLEPALRLGAALDGHLVQGHVDGIGDLMSVREDGEVHYLRFRIPREVHRTTLLHGSIALNGVSLTVNDLVEPDEVEVGIIPHTWSHTNLADLATGDPVNVEGDLIGKYVERLLRAGVGSPPAGLPEP